MSNLKSSPGDSWLKKAAIQYVNTISKPHQRIVERAAFDVLVAAIEGHMVDLNELLEQRGHSHDAPSDPIH